MSREQIVTTGIILARTNFQEADRIITVLTPDQGKIRAIAKGVRKQKSKLAGGIELFSISNLTFLPGRGELQTLISSRLLNHYGTIVKDINRTMLGYEFLKRTNKVTEDGPGEEYFEMLKAALKGLNDLSVSHELVEIWYTMQLLKLTGHSPNLKTDSTGKSLTADQSYIFSFDDMAFVENDAGPHKANLIKLLRLGIGTEEPTIFGKVEGTEKLVDSTLQLAKAILKYNVRV